jgi:2-polyprenyl-3-methyl-5-hydroxy-6-metoxy-1,4-benzoquinol methylase
MQIANNLCVVCHHADGGFAPLYSGLKKCLHCGHCVADLGADSFDDQSIYNEDYFHGGDYGDYVNDRAVFSRHFEDRLREVMTFCPGGVLMDVGCAYGFFLDVARKAFQAVGFDICEVPVRYARETLGLDARHADFTAGSAESASADAITLWDTIEHLPRPDLTIEQVARVLKPGGHVFVTTGDMGSVMARARGPKWRMIHPPTHIHYFSKKTLARLLEAHGLEVVFRKYVGVRRSLQQVAFGLLNLGRTKPSKLYRRIANWRIMHASFVLNTYDIVLMVARKPDAGARR